MEIRDVQLDGGELDCHWIFETLSEWSPDAAVIEVTFNNNGLVERGGYYIAICRLLNIPITKVAVNRWKKEMTGKATNDKELSISVCQQLLPTADLNRSSPKGRVTKPNHDRAEAALLSLYLHRTLQPRPNGT